MSSRMICFDLDGTLVDIREKYCHVHKLSSEDCRLLPLEKDTYWHLKRLRVPEGEILALANSPMSSDLFDAYERRWQTMIESREALEHDAPVGGCFEILGSLKDLGFSLGLVTLRRNEGNALWEIEALGLNKFFERTAISGTASENIALAQKIRLFEHVLDGRREGCAIVGDTELDLLSARYLNVQGIAVSYGIRERALLEVFTQSGVVIDEMNALLKILPAP